MFVSEDGYVNGSIDNSKLDEVKATSPEAKARLEQLKAERDAGQAQAAADAERVAKVAEAQSIQGQQRDVVTTQGRDVVAEAAAAQKANQSDSSDQSTERASTRRSSSDKG